jgi:hypothetical protein
MWRGSALTLGQCHHVKYEASMDPTLPPPIPINSPVPAKQRHGCLTALLIFMLVANGFTSLIYMVRGGAVMAAFPNAPTWSPIALALGCFLNIILTVALFRWKKWAFYAFCVVATVVFFCNTAIGVPLLSRLLGLLGPILLFLVLHIGKANKGWPQLE